MDMDNIFCQQAKKLIPLELVTTQSYSAYLDKQSLVAKNTLLSSQFKANPHKYCIIYDADGQLDKIVVGLGQAVSMWSLASLPLLLPNINYCINDPDALFSDMPLELGWALGSYQFTKYKKSIRQAGSIAIRDNQNARKIKHIVESVYLIRDLINTPAEEMNPANLSQQAKILAEQYTGQWHEIVGQELLEQNFPTIHRVGRAAKGDNVEPRLIKLTWGDPKHKKLTLAGKGVCFDTGGLDLKPSKGMLLMKKDMGGAAHVLGLAKLIMAEQLPIYLTVLIPAVENSIGGDAMRPSDVITSRKGLTIEVGNTDAEGRLVLSDALAYACESKPDLLLDFATLTGAHHAALGPAIPAILTKNQKIRHDLETVSEQQHDLMWSLPLHQNYRPYLDSLTADISNTSRMPYAGCITAGLFLAEFVTDDVKWAHFDLMAYNPEALPGRPIGGEAQGLRAVFEYLNTQWLPA